MMNPVERDIENLLEQRLKSQGWIVDMNKSKRNVYHQRPKSSEEQKKLKGRSPDFYLYITPNSTSPEIIVETKKPGMNLAKTKQQALGYAAVLGSKIIVLFDGVQTKTYWVKNQEPLMEDGLEISVIRTPDFYQKFIREGTHNYINTNVSVNSKEELITVFAFANQKLRKAGITKGMERFFEFSNLLFLKLISENNDIISEIIPQHIRWESYKNKQGDELLSYINEIVIPELERTFNKQGETTLFTKLTLRNTVALKQIVDKLSTLNLSGIKTDIKGDAFEYFIQQYNNSNNDLGEYFTPRHIVNFLVRLACPQYGEKIYDPFCGTGGILISAFNYIKESLATKNYPTHLALKDVKENTVFGGEISSNARIAKMNMILTGDGHSNIQQQDTLKNPVKEKFDIVISNIPFNLEGTASELYSLLNNNGNSQSIQHIVNSLNRKKTARAYIIVPEAVLNNRELKNLRRYLIENNLLTQIISLPSGVFLPYTESKASILVLQGFNNKPVSAIRYTIIKNDGFTLTQRRRKITPQVNDIEEYLFDDSFATREIDVQQILRDSQCSFIWFRYFNEVPEHYVLLKSILKEENIDNTELYETATVTKHEFWGIVRGAEYWGDSFVSVTSDTNDNYKVVNEKSIAYNPARANTGSLSINLTGQKLAVSPMYVVFKVDNPKFLPEYVFLCLRSQEGVQDIKDRSFGSVRQSLRFEDLCTIAIPDIPIGKQCKIVEQAIKLHKQYLESQNLLNTFDVTSLSVR